MRGFAARFGAVYSVFSSDLSLLSVPTENDNHRLSFFVGLRDRARHTHERTRKRSFGDATARSNPRQVFDPCYPYQKGKQPSWLFSFFSIGNRARHVRERICAAYSFEDTTARTYPRQVHRPLLPVPNSRNPNLVPVGDGFGFLFVFDDLTFD